MLNRKAFIGSAVAFAGALGAAGKDGKSGNRVSLKAEVPVSDEVDVLVVGGGPAGVCAAVSAAREGKRVFLAEETGAFGGAATAAGVPAFCRFGDGKRILVSGVGLEVRKMVSREYPVSHDFVPINAEDLKLAYDKVVAESGVRFSFFTKLCAVEKEGRRMSAAVFVSKRGLFAVRAKIFVDATGDADLAARAGFETWTLPKDDLQSQSLCAIFANVGPIYDKYKAFVLNEILKPEFGAGLRHVFGWWAPVVGAHDLYFYAGTRITDCDPSVAEDLTQVLLEARRQIRKIVDAVNRKYPMPDGKRFTLVSLASDLGLRESRHIKAKYRVTEKDVLYGRHFEDCIAKGSYRVDIHEGRGIKFRYLDGKEQKMEAQADGKVAWTEGRWRTDSDPRPTWYEIPLRALQPEKAENLICAGRMIDCTREAFGALRVMVNCNQMGEAAANHVVRQLQCA